VAIPCGKYRTAGYLLAQTLENSASICYNDKNETTYRKGEILWENLF